MFPVKSIVFMLALMLALSAAAAAEETLRVEMQTTDGTVVLELDAARAPKTVENFLAYVDRGFYDGLIFHRVIPGFMAQAGGFDVDYQPRAPQPPIPPVENESRNGLKNLRGTIAMARTSEPHSASSQFFINLVDNTRLDGKPHRWGYTVFGRVVEGMEVIDAIAEIPTGPAGPFYRDVPQGRVVIESMRRAAKSEGME